MKGKKRAPEQIEKLLEEADARLNANQSLSQACQALEIVESTYYRWRNQYDGMKSEEARRLKFLEKENAQLKHMIGELMLDKAMLKEKKYNEKRPHSALGGLTPKEFARIQIMMAGICPTSNELALDPFPVDQIPASSSEDETRYESKMNNDKVKTLI